MLEEHINESTNQTKHIYLIVLLSEKHNKILKK